MKVSTVEIVSNLRKLNTEEFVDTPSIEASNKSGDFSQQRNKKCNDENHSGKKTNFHKVNKNEFNNWRIRSDKHTTNWE